MGRFLRSLRWSDKSQNTLDTYEIVLARLACDHAHFKSLDEFTTETIRDFLDEHWGESSPATRRNRLAVVKSFLRWAADKRGLAVNPADKIKPPRKANVERQAYAPDTIEQLRTAQPTLREQIAVRLLGRLGLRKNELRLLKVADFDLTQGTFLVHGKGGKVVVMPIAFADLKADLELELRAREPDEYLLHPKWSPKRPFDPSALHLHFKSWLELAQQLLRHESVATTQAYLHPSRDDLAQALTSLEVVKSEPDA